MRIALFSDTFFPQVNGVATVVATSARDLIKRGHEVCVVTNSSPNSMMVRSTKTKDGYQLITVPSVRFPLYPGERLAIPLGMTVYQMKKFRPQIIHAHTPFSVGLEALYLSRVFRVPLIGTHHTFHDHYLRHLRLDFDWAKWLSWKYIVGFYNRCHYVLSQSKALAEALEEHGLMKPITILPNAVDASFFSPADVPRRVALRSSLQLSGPVFVYVGRLSYEKNVAAVLEAVALAQKKLQRITLLVVGDGPERESLEALTKARGIADSVRFLGMKSSKEIVEILQVSDGFITASCSENMPMTILEAMAVGLPIVGVRALGVPELVKEKENGFLAEPGDTKALAAALVTLAEESELQERYGKSSRQLALQYDPEKLLLQLETIYKQALND
ncbi:MAG: glycosyltransferase [Patescibacteria group bacterium]|jgi:glycosyltransferase involved in cell wall biosynthesis